MADINKIGLLLLSADKKTFLLCEKDSITTDYILPGGGIEEGETDEQCLAREIQEELSAELNKKSLQYLGEFEDLAAGYETKRVNIRLYQGLVQGTPVPSQEIKKLHWLSVADKEHPRLSSIIKKYIFPYIIEHSILHE